MTTERTDEELLAAFQQGDAGAFELLLRRHRAPLFTFLLRMLGDRERAEDLAQETLLRIVKGAAAWERRATFRTWLYTIARNLCVDSSRRDRFRRTDSLDETVSGDDDRAVIDGVPAGGVSPERGAESSRLRPLLVRALRALPVEQREVFVLREQAGLGFREIAELVGVNENTVKSRMRYALEAMRRTLAQNGVDAGHAQEPTPPAGVRWGRA